MFGMNIFGQRRVNRPTDPSLVNSSGNNSPPAAGSADNLAAMTTTTTTNVDIAPPPPSYEEAYTLPSAAPAPAHIVYKIKEKRSEIKLFESATERKRYEELADLYSIIKTTESIEAAYSRDAIGESEYSEICKRLLAQFKTTESALIAAGAIESVETFIKCFNIDCPRAMDRLVRVGVPATVIYSSKDDRGESVIVANTVQAFITAMDALKLDQRAVDEVHPLISELMSSVTRVPNVPADYEGIGKMDFWLKKLNAMRAADTISEEDARQLMFDLESAYSAFHKLLGDAAKRSH